MLGWWLLTGSDVKKSRVLVAARQTISVGEPKHVETVVEGHNNYTLLITDKVGSGPNGIARESLREATTVDPQKDRIARSTAGS